MWLCRESCSSQGSFAFDRIPLNAGLCLAAFRSCWFGHVPLAVDIIGAWRPFVISGWEQLCHSNSKGQTSVDLICLALSSRWWDKDNPNVPVKKGLCWSCALHTCALFQATL